MTTYRDATRAPKRRIALAACLVIVVASCSGTEELTLTEYAEEVEGLTTTMYRTLDDLTITAEDGSEVPVEDAQAVYDGAAAAFRQLRDGLQAIEPPDGVADLHAASIDIMNRFTAAQEAFARRAEDYKTADDWDLLYETPEALAVDAVQGEMIAFCQARQAEFDSTADREVFADVPWIPPEMQEVVTVLFGCGTEESGGS